MKRNDFQKSLKKIKKEINTVSSSKNSFTDTSTTFYEKKASCTCNDAQGNPKLLYTSEKEAQNALTYLKLNLSIYPCPSERGWHLTKG